MLLSPDVKAGEVSTELKPRAIYEECMEVTEEQKLTYSYSSSQPLDFNIHYHVGNIIYFPLRKTSAELKDVYLPKVVQSYCLMWKNNSDQDVELTGEYSVSPRD